MNSRALVSLTSEIETEGVLLQLLFEALRRFHPGEPAAENQDAFLRRLGGRMGCRFGAEQSLSAVVQRLHQQAEGHAIEHPSHEGGKVVAHLRRAPLRHLSRQKWQSDDAENSPERHAESARRHHVVEIGAGGLPSAGRKGCADRRTEQRLMPT